MKVYSVYDSKDQQGNMIFTLCEELYDSENQLVATNKIAIFDSEEQALKRKKELING